MWQAHVWILTNSSMCEVLQELSLRKLSIWGMVSGSSSWGVAKWGRQGKTKRCLIRQVTSVATGAHVWDGEHTSVVPAGREGAGVCVCPHSPCCSLQAALRRIGSLTCLACPAAQPRGGSGCAEQFWQMLMLWMKCPGHLQGPRASFSTSVSLSFAWGNNNCFLPGFCKDRRTQSRKAVSGWWIQ